MLSSVVMRIARRQPRCSAASTALSSNRDQPPVFPQIAQGEDLHGIAAKDVCDKADDLFLIPCGKALCSRQVEDLSPDRHFCRVPQLRNKSVYGFAVFSRVKREQTQS